MKNAIFLVLAFFCLLPAGRAQNFFKVSCHVSIKEKSPQGEFALYKGRAEYDKFSDQTVYQLSFPHSEKWVFEKQKMTKFKDGKKILERELYYLNDYSVFKLFLEGTLKNYGLRKSAFQGVSVEQKNGQIRTTWEMPQAAKSPFGKVITARQNNRLSGVAFFDKNKQLVAKQVFEKYQPVKGLYFPTQIIHISYTPQGEYYRLIEFSKVEIQ